jgi:hypothetical protein
LIPFFCLAISHHSMRGERPMGESMGAFVQDRTINA